MPYQDSTVFFLGTPEEIECLWYAHLEVTTCDLVIHLFIYFEKALLRQERIFILMCLSD